MKYRIFITVLGLTLFWASNTSYASPEFEVVQSKSQIHAKETFDFILKIRWPKEEGFYRFAIPDLQTENLEVIRRGQSDETLIQSQKTWNRKTITWELKPLGPGTGRILDIILPYIDPEIQKTGKLLIPGASITIEEAPRQAPPWLFIAVAAAGAGGLAFGALVFLLKKRKKTEEPQRLTAHELTVQKLKSILESQTYDNEKDHLQKVSLIFRQFVANYFQLPDAQMTEDELLNALKGKGILKTEFEPIEQLLNQIRDVKYQGQESNSLKKQQIQRKILEYIESKRVLSI